MNNQGVVPLTWPWDSSRNAVLLGLRKEGYTTTANCVVQKSKLIEKTMYCSLMLVKIQGISWKHWIFRALTWGWQKSPLLKGPGRPWGWSKPLTPPTRCFLPDQKALFLAKVIAFWNNENTGNYSTHAGFKRDFPTMTIFGISKPNPPTIHFFIQ